MTNYRVKILATAVIALPLLAITIFKASPVRAVAHPAADAVAGLEFFLQEDVAAQYKKTCAVCHKPNAEKFFEPSKMDEVLIEIVLKGKKAEKPPNMPGYEEKGMTKDQAKLLVGYMRQMRTPATE